jgi:hypothetical protein
MNANAKSWVAALRSGKYRQGKGALCRGADYCCLGVACDLAVKAGLPIEVGIGHDGKTSFGFNVDALPVEVSDWLGLRDCYEFSVTDDCPYFNLAELNDVGDQSFCDIADFIERHEKSLFIPNHLYERHQ